MLGQQDRDPSRSTITLSIQELQRLVELKGGTGTPRGANREVIDFGVVIGTHRDSATDPGRPTTRSTIHYSKTSAHLVPAKPKPSRKKGGDS